MAKSPVQLVDLPDEILLLTFGFLPSSAVISCLQVNRRFNQIIERSRKILAKSQINLSLKIVDKDILSFCLADAERTNFPRSTEPLLIQTNSEDDDDKLEGQLLEVLASFRTKSTPTEIYTSTNLQSALRIILAFILHRCHVANLHISDLSICTLDSVNNLLLEDKCRPSIIHMTLDEELSETTEQTLQLAEKGINLRGSSKLDKEFFAKYFLRKLKKIEINMLSDNCRCHIGNAIRNFSASEINISNPCHIKKEDVVHLVEVWFAGKREINLYEFIVHIPKKKFELNFDKNIPLSNISNIGKYGKRFTRPQDDQRLVFNIDFYLSEAPWFSANISTESPPSRPLKRKLDSEGEE